jgi:ferric-dicitrate binding protein FerR (iron transport regulator)
VVVAIIAGTWLLKMTDAGITDHSKEQVIAGTVLPGSNKATLTLSDGHIITLDSTINSTITEQNGIKIINLASGRLSYKSGIIKSKIVKSFNTLTTPRGGQYQVILPDGTQVWLNAASSITYPTAFTGDRREVSITGEVYMEVTTDKTKPFIVQAREIAIEVLGTHFNINAYADEPAIQTTLLEGSVRVTSQSTVIYHPSSVILIPGQQARLIPGTSLQLVQADASQVVAWKNGIFQFNKSPLPVVLRHLSRWYDMEIVYKSEVPTLHVGGKMQRNLPLADVLDVLKRVGVQFKIEGNKLIVLEQ